MSSIDDDEHWNSFSNSPTSGRKKWVLTNHIVNPLFKDECKKNHVPESESKIRNALNAVNNRLLEITAQEKKLSREKEALIRRKKQLMDKLKELENNR